ncbi:MAG: alpha/beta fold hydrolase [Parvularculaceae bacterium]
MASHDWRLHKRIDTSAGVVAAGCAGDGPDLVLAHGWPWSSFAWRRLIPDLARDFRVWWYDMPGYGRSAKDPDQPTGLDVQGDVFAEMMDAFSLRRPIVVAHDFGGATTLRAHLLGDVGFEKLVLMNVVAMRPWGSAFFDHVGRHVDAFFGLPPHIHEAVVRAYVKGALVNDVDAADFEGLVSPWLTDDGRVSFYRQFAQADERYTAAFEPLLPKMRCPTAILWGEDDPWIPIARGRALQERLGAKLFSAMPRLGHLPQLEDPAAVLSALRHALQETS